MTKLVSYYFRIMSVGLASVMASMASGCADQATVVEGDKKASEQPVSEVYQSGGQTIPVEWFPAKNTSSSPHPAVVILHGSEGFTTGGDDYYDAARQLSQAGYQAFVVHYFARTGDSFVLRRSTIRERLPAWEATVRDGINYVGSHKNVASDQIGVLGASLGGGLALLAGRNNQRVKAVVDYFGFYPEQLTLSDQLPPVLLLHGGKDAVLPVAENSQKVKQLLDRMHVPNELVIYPQAGHGFRGAEGAEAKRDAAGRAKTFFSRYLSTR